jgi:hypothetical protein
MLWTIRPKALQKAVELNDGFPCMAPPQQNQRSGCAMPGVMKDPALPGHCGAKAKRSERELAEGVSDAPRVAPSATSHAFLDESRSGVSGRSASGVAAAAHLRQGFGGRPRRGRYRGPLRQKAFPKLAVLNRGFRDGADECESGFSDGNRSGKHAFTQSNADLRVTLRGDSGISSSPR